MRDRAGSRIREVPRTIMVPSRDQSERRPIRESATTIARVWLMETKGNTALGSRTYSALRRHIGNYFFTAGRIAYR